MASNYPGSLDSFTTKTNKEDLVDAAHMNDVQNAIVATQTELGTNPAKTATDVSSLLGAAPEGTFADIDSRLDHMQDEDGAIAKGTSFPVTGLVDGQIFYRTDENVLYVYNGSSWDSQGQSLSNVLFCWIGVDNLDSNHGLYVGTDQSIDLSAPTTVNYLYIASDNTSAYENILFGKFTKIAGISTVTIQARIWSQGGNNADLEVDIGGQTNNVTRNNTSPGWATTSDVDVSGLSDGTTYDITIGLRVATSGDAYCSAVMLIGS